MSRRALAAVVVLAAVLLGGGVWWGTQPQASSPETTSTTPVAPLPARAPPEAPTKRHAEPEADDDVSVPSSGGVSIGGGRGVERPKATFAFVVRTEDGTPIAGARLSVRKVRRGRGTDVGATDAGGRASVTVALDGNELLMVDADGFVSREARRGDDVVVLKPWAPIAGFVVDHVGRPVVGARVSGDSDGAETDVAGRFEIAVDPYADDVALTVRHDGFLRWEGERRPGDRDVRVRLMHGCTIEGRIVLPDGRAPEAGGVDIVDVDKDGAFHASGLAPGERVLSAWGRLGDRTFAAELPLTLQDGETRRDLRIVLRENPRSFALLRVLGPDGSSVTFGAARAAHSAGDGAESGGRIVVPVDGPAGREERVTLYRASAGEIEYGDLSFDVVTRATPDGEPLVVTLPRRSTLEVHVAWPDGGSTPRPTLWLERTDGPAVLPGIEWSGLTKALIPVAVGASYRVHVQADGYAPTIRDVTPDELAAGKATVRLSPGATVRVHLVARPPARLSEPWITLGADGAGAWRVFPENGVRADGRYEIAHVRAGRCDARMITCGSIVETRLTIDVPESGVLDLGDVVLAGTTTLKGRVLAPDGRPAGGAALEYFDPRRLSPCDGVHAATAADGTFAFDVPVGAAGDLLATKDDFGGVIVALDGKTSWIDVRLQPECRLRVLLRAKSANGWSPSISLARPDGTGLWCPPPDGERREAATEVVRPLRGLAPGKWVVRLHEETPPIEREVTLSTDGVAELVIDEP